MGKNETTLGPFSVDACVETILWKQSGGTDQQGWSHRINLKVSVGEQNLPPSARSSESSCARNSDLRIRGEISARAIVPVG